ncbi:MAG TPA: hypothetical protein VIL81_00805 [Candidatus Limnocylindrales bacterium]
MPPARTLHASVGEASAVRGECGAQLIDGVRVRADDAARLLVEGEEPDVKFEISAGRVLLRDGVRDPTVGRFGGRFRRSGEEGSSSADADERGNGQDPEGPSAAAVELCDADRRG